MQPESPDLRVAGDPARNALFFECARSLVNPSVLVQQALAHLGKASLLLQSDFFRRFLRFSHLGGCGRSACGGPAANDVYHRHDNRAILCLLRQQKREVGLLLRP